MKTLVVVTHPDIANSVVNKRWLEELRRYPERYTVHELHQAYPDWQIDVAQEQRLIEAHDNIVLQFPIFWFSSPPLLKNGWTTCSPTAGPTVPAAATRCKTRSWRWRSRRGCVQRIMRATGAIVIRWRKSSGRLKSPPATCGPTMLRSSPLRQGGRVGRDGGAAAIPRMDRSAQGYQAFLAALN